jgi:phosphoribosylaminoimidazole-succinocarboxamide synthase
MSGVLETNLKSLPFLHRGKVRDIYAVGDDKLLVIQTDRLSAFDVILNEPIPEKGKILTSMSNFWFAKYKDMMPNHDTGIDPVSLVAPGERAQVDGRAIVVKKMTPLGIEAIVRGYLIGSGAKAAASVIYALDQGPGRRPRREHLV